MIQSIQTDVLIIGSGAAGIRAAIEASRQKAQVMILSSSRTGRANNTAISYGGFNAALGQDRPEDHYRDTLAGGCGINKTSLVRLLTEEVPSEVKNMENMGVRFLKESNGQYVLAGRGGHSVARRLSTASNSGLDLINPLLKHINLLGIKRLEGFRTCKLLKKDEAINGVLALDRKGDWTVISAKSIILATGGGGALFPVTTNVPDALGSGYILAYESGLNLRDMEFIQFVPIIQTEPGLPRRLPPVELFLLKGAILRNSSGQDLIALKENFTFTRDAITRLIAEENQRGTDGQVYIDLKKLPPDEFKALKDYRNKKLRVLFASHFFMGGIEVGHDLTTPIQGLFAAGEIMGGVHGANRLGGNALAETFVFGAQAGRLAALYAAQKTAVPAYEPAAAREVVEEFKRSLGLEPQSRDSLLKWEESERQIKRIMEESAGPARRRETLEEGLIRLNTLKEGISGFAPLNQRDWWSLTSVKQQITLAEIILRSALTREESRGAHFRLDFPNQDDERWKVNILVQKDHRGAMILSEQVNLN